MPAEHVGVRLDPTFDLRRPTSTFAGFLLVTHHPPRVRCPGAGPENCRPWRLPVHLPRRAVFVYKTTCRAWWPLDRAVPVAEHGHRSSRGTDRGMSVSGVRQRAGPSQGASRPVFDLATAKLLRPVVRPETIRRSSLIERLARDDSRPIVSVVAPAGYGKTTLLAQWAERNGQAFAWVSVDEKDNDPKVLLAYVAEALNAIEPVGQRVFDALASPGSSVPGSVVPRLGSAFASMISPVVLVLDDVHLLDDSACRAALSALADHVPGGSRLRAEGKILEIGPGDLTLTHEEASAL